MSNLDRVTEAARTITNLGLPDNCVYSKLTPFEQSVVQEFIQACFDGRRELQDVCVTMRQSTKWGMISAEKRATTRAIAMGTPMHLKEVCDD